MNKNKKQSRWAVTRYDIVVKSHLGKFQSARWMVDTFFNMYLR